MKLNILLKTSDYRGDHSADIWVAHEVKPQETVEELAKRLLTNPQEVIEIRVVGDA